MKNWKSAIVPALWLIVGLIFCYHDASGPTAVAFGRQVGAYALGASVFFAILVVLSFCWRLGSKLVEAWVNADEPSEEDFGEDAAYDAACAWRAINLAISEGHEHVDACLELSDLREAGWHIEKAGNERAGFVYLKFIAPSKKE
jgi:hypothetical protein